MGFACLASCFPLGSYLAYINPKVGPVGLTHPSPHSEMNANPGHADQRVFPPLDLEIGLSWPVTPAGPVASSPGQCASQSSRMISQGNAGDHFFFLPHMEIASQRDKRKPMINQK